VRSFKFWNDVFFWPLLIFPSAVHSQSIICSRLSDIFTPFGLLPGGGQFIQKIPLGVTVCQVEYINNTSVSSPAHPLYALLVAREVETDLSRLNDDGLTSAEREAAKKKKEEEKMQKQVEADLGGFDVEQEWVEEIEREECFEIEKRYGGAPPILTKTYEIWVRDMNCKEMVVTFIIGTFKSF
jgi:cleavage and polyadenylation specificity factor subunit 1